ncbi:LRR receptor-like serine/threonine-protein kinase FEI 1 [Durio zibethinus]|uniref:LRR receptor-like serine/threonine-protein kinase FEI 1 n=1 Tax=Durio zibethinus TaxID=66656 RepID=A0A6P5WPK3_DURZI|nr:LRR receptor-like serine/threonine-protein kinase FEI 1 [Durio zibethinus]
MEDTRFILPLMVVMLLHNLVPSFSMESPNITTDRLALLALKAYVTRDPQNVFGNQTGPLPPLSANWIGETIPPILGNLSFLTSLNIRNNSFHASLPIELVNLRRLKLIDIGSNSFSGEIPSWFGSFPELQSLFLYGNNFTGVIPSSLGDLSKLEKLVLYNNSLGRADF